MTYSFEISNDLNRIVSAGKLINIIERFGPQYSRDTTKVFGQLLAIFGDPIYVTKNMEDAYSYVIIAKDENDIEHVLNVYEGSTGPAIGGYESSLDAAQQLAEQIRSAQPMDYEYEGYYFDGPTKIHKGVTNGEVFYSEVEISDDEFRQAYNEYEKNYLI